MRRGDDVRRSIGSCGDRMAGDWWRWEIDQLGRAVDATVLGLRETVNEIPIAAGSGGERRLQRTFHGAARLLGR